MLGVGRDEHDCARPEREAVPQQPSHRLVVDEGEVEH
jgi:hypothetical protein